MMMRLLIDFMIFLAGGLLGAVVMACLAAGSREDEHRGYDMLDDEWKRRNP